MGESARIVSGWDFQRIIPCHGAVIEGEEAKKAWNSAFDWYLKQ